MKILYADTDPVSQVNFVNALKGNTSWNAKYALSNSAVQLALIQESFDLVIADLSFIDIVLEATSAMPGVAVIAIGDVEDLSEVEYLFSKGVAQYLKKPFYGNIFQEISEDIENQILGNEEENDIIPDFGYLDRLTRGRVALKIDLMEIYLTVVGEELVKMAEAADTGAVNIIGDSAHRMKSNVRMMGLQILMERLDQIEHLVREENCDDTFFELVKSTSNLLHRTLTKVKAEIESAKTLA